MEYPIYPFLLPLVSNKIHKFPRHYLRNKYQKWWLNSELFSENFHLKCFVLRQVKAKNHRNAVIQVLILLGLAEKNLKQ